MNEDTLLPGGARGVRPGLAPLDDALSMGAAAVSWGAILAGASTTVANRRTHCTRRLERRRPAPR